MTHTRKQRETKEPEWKKTRCEGDTVIVIEGTGQKYREWRGKTGDVLVAYVEGRDQEREKGG